MSFYRWTAIDSEKVHTTGVDFAASSGAIKLRLNEQRLTPVTVKKLTPMKNRSGHRHIWLIQFLNRWIALTEAGYDQLQAFVAMQRQSASQEEAAALQAICHAIRSGQTVTSSMSRFPHLFNAELRQQIAVAEQTGQYSIILPQQARYLERKYKQIKKMKDGLRYPLAVMGMALLLLAGMQLWILPAFEKVYQQMGVPLPAITELILSFSGAKGLVLLCSVSLFFVLTFTCFRLMQKYGWKNHALAQFVYRVTPSLLGYHRHLLHDLEILRNNIASGIPLAEACQLTSRYSASSVWQYHWLTATVHIHQGMPLHRVLSPTQLPVFVLDYVETGELTGQLLQQLQLAITQLKDLSDQALQQLCRYIPTLVLSLVAVMSLLILLAIYLPLFQLGGWVG